MLTQPGAAIGPTGVVTATSTPSRAYGSQVEVSYLEPVNCALAFSEEVADFTVSSLNVSAEAVISNFVEVNRSYYEFQVGATDNANVSLYIPAQTVTTIGGDQNDVNTAFFSFRFFAYPPSVTLRLGGYEAQSTNRPHNTAYLVFNQTTVYDSTAHIAESLVSFSPDLEIREWQRESEFIYKFKFSVARNTTPGASNISCVDEDYDLLADENETAGVPQTAFKCNVCARDELCLANTTLPPGDLAYMEFPFQLNIDAVPELGLAPTALECVYDTLWAEVDIDAPTHAREPFWVTVTWTEDMGSESLTLVQPTLRGPPVDQVMLQQNLTVLSPRSYKLLIAPTETGVVEIRINGTVDSQDLAGNANNYQVNTLARTGDDLVVVYSAGPPLQGSIGFAYTRPGYLYETAAVAAVPVGTSSLQVSWDGFVTAEQYDMWIQWGFNMSTPVITNLTTTSYTFSDFEALFGLEYTVYVRAYNYYWQATTVSAVFLHPDITLVADGSYSIMEMPSFMSQLQTDVALHVLVPSQAFLSLNPIQAMRFRSADRAGGDADPCNANSAMQRCTFMSFHIEVPDTQFIVFRQPIKLQFSFGPQGWEDLYFEPRLMYWEAYMEEWRSAAASCPADLRTEEWNGELRIYTVSVCHLSQFSIFEAFKPPDPTTTTPEPPRPSSNTSPVVFVTIAGVVVAFVALCGLCFYFMRRRVVHSSGRAARDGFGNLGIRPVSERIPRFKGGVVAPLSPKPLKNDEEGQLLALPAPGPDYYASTNRSGSTPAPSVGSSSRGDAGRTTRSALAIRDEPSSPRLEARQRPVSAPEASGGKKAKRSKSGTKAPFARSEAKASSSTGPDPLKDATLVGMPGALPSAA